MPSLTTDALYASLHNGRRSIKGMGCAYLRQSIVLVSYCQRGIVSCDFLTSQPAQLSAIIKYTSEALAGGAKITQETQESNDLFSIACYALTLYYQSDHSTRDGFIKDMEDARKKDRAASSMKQRVVAQWEKMKAHKGPLGSELECDIHVLGLSKEEHQLLSIKLNPSQPLFNVLYLLIRLTSDSSTLKINLEKNPHFYISLRSQVVQEAWPCRPLEYQNSFPKDSTVKTLYVILDKDFRIVFKRGDQATTFGNIWEYENTIILKDIGGTLNSSARLRSTFNVTGARWSKFESEDTQDSAGWNPIKDPLADDWDSLIQKGLSGNLKGDFLVETPAQQPLPRNRSTASISVLDDEVPSTRTMPGHLSPPSNASPPPGTLQHSAARVDLPPPQRPVRQVTSANGQPPERQPAQSPTMHMPRTQQSAPRVDLPLPQQPVRHVTNTNGKPPEHQPSRSPTLHTSRTQQSAPRVNPPPPQQTVRHVTNTNGQPPEHQPSQSPTLHTSRTQQSALRANPPPPQQPIRHVTSANGQPPKHQPSQSPTTHTSGMAGNIQIVTPSSIQQPSIAAKNQPTSFFRRYFVEPAQNLVSRLSR